MGKKLTANELFIEAIEHIYRSLYSPEEMSPDKRRNLADYMRVNIIENNHIVEDDNGDLSDLAGSSRFS